MKNISPLDDSISQGHNTAANVQTPKRPALKTGVLLLLLILALAGLLLAFLGFIQFILHMQKDTEEYKVAYAYFVESDTFAQLDAEESDIRMNQYSHRVTRGFGDETGEETTQIGFMVDWQFYTVVCHKEDGIWQVCPECTKID